LNPNSSLVFVGLAPSSKPQGKNSSLYRLRRWIDTLYLSAVDFCNVFPDELPEVIHISTMDLEPIKKRLAGKRKIIALGGMVSNILTKAKIEHLKVDHPSPRNRNFNKEDHELITVLRMRQYIDT